MEFSTLEIFHAVATQKSVTRAARHLARVQSNVTTRVRHLEEELDVQLFSRSGRRMTLTPKGQQMLGYAQRLLSLAEEARQAMKPDQAADRLRIGAMESTAAARLPGLLSAYHSRWPQIAMDISIGTSRSLMEDVLGDRLDCAFVAEAVFQGAVESINPFAARGLQATRAYTEEMLLVLPPNHAPVKRPRDITLTTAAVFPGGCAYRGVLEGWLGHADSQHRGWNTLELASYHAILASVAAGSCFALCPKSVLDLQRAPLDVVTRPIAMIDTFLVARAAYRSGAYEELVQYVRTWASNPT
ncbi:LysR substrate-binding domain-containing protein [Paraburkholderia sp. BCC1885]|uniref:LysR substrate-binding domain-containing protein n=1 Tax=Paraburkholderia sp. BCC1885 TaxID=2562669 RepID=UPI00118342C0|nr:LysR substrate-binding domain-containing protein [Paraburkholderia sp. BCC1885]